MTDIVHRRHVLTFKEKLELADFMKSVVETNDDGFAFYKVGWTDTAVAKRMKCTPGNVQGVRIHLYPKFLDKNKVPSPSETAVALREELDTLQRRVAAIEDYLTKELGVNWTR